MKDKAAISLGWRGGQKTASLYGSEHFSKAAKSRKSFKGGRPKLPLPCKLHKYFEDGCKYCETFFHIRILDEKDFVFDPKDF